MANEKTREALGALRAAPVLEGETWKQYIDRLRKEPSLGASQVAGIMAATVLMGKDPNAPARGRMLDALSDRLIKQPSFRRLVRDPETLRLARGGKGAEIIVRMGEKKRQEEEERRRYQRDPNKVREDAAFFRAVLKSMKDSFANHSAAQRERESQRFLEMTKRIDHARSMAEQGIPLDGKTARELAQAVQAYNNGGTKTPGGKQQAAASKEALCVLKRLMPEDAFNSYCADINRAHQAQSPAHRRHVNPADYGEALLNGGARTARDLMLASQRQMNKGMTLDGCATVTAIMKLSRGNPNAIVRREALETEIKKLKAPGSAFLRAMSDDAARGRYAELASKGETARLTRRPIPSAPPSGSSTSPLPPRQRINPAPRWTSWQGSWPPGRWPSAPTLPRISPTAPSRPVRSRSAAARASPPWPPGMRTTRPSGTASTTASTRRTAAGPWSRNTRRCRPHRKKSRRSKKTSK